MDNVHGDNELPLDTLRRAVNLDITDSGKLKLRKGSTLALAIENAHSLWSDTKGNAYLVHDNKLKRFMPDFTTIDLGDLAAGQNHVSFQKVNEDIYLSCATAKGVVRNGQLQGWGIEVPSSPALMIESTGVMHAGVYHAAVTYVTADGRESGASVLSSIEIEGNRGITFAGLPDPVDTAVKKKRIYLSPANSEMLYRVAELDPLDQFFSLSVLPNGPELRTAYMMPPPNALGLAMANGRIFMIDAEEPRVVWYTEPMAYDLVDKRENYYVFPEPCTMIAATRSGLYVASDKTYYIGLAGLAEASRTVIYEYGAIANTVQQIPRTSEYIWMSERGAVIGHDGGQAEILSEYTLVPGQMQNAASMVREEDGLRQFVVVGNNSEAAAMQAGSFAEAEIVRRAS
jgi:hypothetical protein